MRKWTRIEAGWAVKLWVFATVFVIWFLDAVEVVGWLALGGMLGFVWKMLPEGVEKPVEPLPYAHLYRDREIPRVEEVEPPPRPSAQAEGEVDPGGGGREPR